MDIDSTIARRTAAVAAALVLTLAACGGGDDDGDEGVAPTSTAGAASGAAAAPGDPVVEIAGFAFSGVSSVPAGTVLTVVNDDSAPHTFTADDGSFDTGAIQPGESAEITLSTVGTVAFHCELHGSMTGSITVT